MWVGANFLFGHDRSGNFSLLRLLGARYGFRAEKIDPVRYKEFVVSSTRVRRLVSEGRVDEAATLLGRHYFLDGVVVQGLQRGRLLGFPTANLETPNELRRPTASTPPSPPSTASCTPRSRTSGSGRRSTSRRRPSIETHILDMDRYLYGMPMRVSFLQRIRDERTFDGVDALKAQIAADCGRARHLFAQLSL